MNEREALLANILANPDVDMFRLVYADWLECDAEPKEPERAEYIRLGCELMRLEPRTPEDCERRELLKARRDELGDAHECNWFPIVQEVRASKEEMSVTITRGFISEVEGPMDWLNGGPCATCNGYGHHHRNDSLSVEQVRRWPHLICETCHGERRTPGRLAELVKTQPIAYVQPTDKEPDENGDKQFSWFYRPNVAEQRSDLPRDIYSIMVNGCMPIRSGVVNFSTKQAAQQALSDAILTRAKQPS